MEGVGACFLVTRSRAVRWACTWSVHTTKSKRTKRMSTTETQINLATLAASLGVTLESSSPTAGVDKDKGADGKPHNWPHIRYTVTLSRNGRAFWSGPYKLGTGHVKRPATMADLLKHDRMRLRFSWNHLEHSAQYRQNTGRNVTFLPDIEANIAAELAAVQKVTPKLPDVLHSLLMDGSAYFDAQRFEDWAADLGYSDDSIKARETFDACDRIGRDLARAFSKEELAQLRDAASNY